MRMLSRLLLVLCLGLIAACSPVSSVTDVEVHVDWVIDGDTIIVDGERVRLIDVDTPELGTERGKDAKWFMIELAYDEWVSMSCDGYDRYDRRLCLVYVDGVSVSDSLLDAGLATEWR